MKLLALAILLVVAMVGAALAQNRFDIAADSRGTFSSQLRLPPTYVDARVLAANTNEDHTVPTNARYVVFSANCAEFYVKRGGTAAVPAADVTDGTSSELNPAGYFVDGVTTLGIIAPAVCTVTLSFYR